MWGLLTKFFGVSIIHDTAHPDNAKNFEVGMSITHDTDCPNNAKDSEVMTKLALLRPAYDVIVIAVAPTVGHCSFFVICYDVLKVLTNNDLFQPLAVMGSSQLGEFAIDVIHGK